MAREMRDLNKEVTRLRSVARSQTLNRDNLDKHIAELERRIRLLEIAQGAASVLGRRPAGRHGPAAAYTEAVYGRQIIEAEVRLSRLRDQRRRAMDALQDTKRNIETTIASIDSLRRLRASLGCRD